MRILSRSDVQRAITMAQAIEAMRDAFAQLASGEADVPARTALPIVPHEAVTLFMPARLGGGPVLGGKIVSVHPHNRAAGLPVIHALVVLIDEANRLAAWGSVQGGIQSAHNQPRRAFQCRLPQPQAGGDCAQSTPVRFRCNGGPESCRRKCDRGFAAQHTPSARK